MIFAVADFENNGWPGFARGCPLLDAALFDSRPLVVGVLIVYSFSVGGDGNDIEGYIRRSNNQRPDWTYSGTAVAHTTDPTKRTCHSSCAGNAPAFRPHKHPGGDCNKAELCMTGSLGRNTSSASLKPKQPKRADRRLQASIRP
jgi:hypothetical protein